MRDIKTRIKIGCYTKLRLIDMLSSVFEGSMGMLCFNM